MIRQGFLHFNDESKRIVNVDERLIYNKIGFNSTFWSWQNKYFILLNCGFLDVIS